MSQLEATVASCPHCQREGMAVYLRDGRPIGCSGCLGIFFKSLRPEERPWEMSFWDDIRSFFSRR